MIKPGELSPGFLENIGNNADGPDRFQIWRLRYQANKIAKNHPVSSCGRFHYKDKALEVWSSVNNKSYFKHLISCGSVHACPVCRYKIMDHRTSEIIQVCKGAQASGLVMGFLTLTQSHRKCKGNKARKQLKSVNDIWRYIMGIPSLRRAFKECRFEYIKGWDIRYNKNNGYHPHLHIIVFADTRENSEMLCNTIIDQWLYYNPGSMKDFQNYKPVYGKPEEEVPEYITKMKAGLELTNKTLSKEGDSVHPLDWLKMLKEKDFDLYSEKECIHLYNAYIQLSKGIRTITYSKGLKKRYIKTELSDTEICENTDDLKEFKFIVGDQIFYKLREEKKLHYLLRATDRALKDDNLSLLGELRRELSEILSAMRAELILGFGNKLTFATALNYEGEDNSTICAGYEAGRVKKMPEQKQGKQIMSKYYEREMPTIPENVFKNFENDVKHKNQSYESANESNK